ncbi:GNAT family N-acetyltransferase [Nocardia veterana]|uniref:GNAT family N-acetyltransferase n=1 Tax=Nocardia veterana TaxID=132249 RepID=A0A7X6LZJ9_9NOCA|nr:GNAT family N-acetyltransferase [Nocardia veterana]NKY87540.1 GNAT family N-acetyltransferase [Nocardia veterana]
MAAIVERAIGVQEYRRLRAEVGWSTPDHCVCATALATSLFSVVAHDEQGRSVGMARAVCDGLYVLIVDVVVSPPEQGQGIGTQLIDSVVEWARQQRVPHLALGASMDVAGLYHQHGFVQAGQYLRFIDSIALA